MDDNVPPKLFSHLSSAADILKDHDMVYIFSHHDADGISAAVILAKAMIRAGKEFKVTLFSTLNDENFDIVKNCGARCIIIADMGASYVEGLDTMSADVIVLDHHKGYAEAKRIHHINPHSYGIDGMSSGCGASMAMLFALQMSEKNWDMLNVAFAGMVGDKQHGSLTGINRYLFDEGTKRGYITKEDGSLIPSGELMRSLYHNTEPYVRGVSGNADGVAALLDSAKIDATKTSSDLSDAEKRKLSSQIALRLLEQNVSLETLNEISCARYVFKNGNIDAATLASLFDSCGRSGIGGVGIGLGLGDRACFENAMDSMDETTERVLAAAKELDSNGLENMENIQFFNNSASGFTGKLCELAIRYLSDGNRPVVGCTAMEKITKVSSRCTHALLEKGVDLSVAMKAAGETAGGGGGGHRIASGAWFPNGNDKIFLETLDRIVGEHISAR
jgi:RecJ-like exonuclease